MKYIKKTNRGQSMLELALVLPVLLLLLFGIFEFGRLFHDYMVITSAAREGARSSAVGASNAVVVTRVKNSAASIGDTSHLVININKSIVDGQVKVTVNHTVTLITPLISSFFPNNPVPVQGMAVMRLE